jgi:LPS O-antigen subunit length determinant protein (WzzB/FepE family)
LVVITKPLEKQIDMVSIFLQWYDYFIIILFIIILFIIMNTKGID